MKLQLILALRYLNGRKLRSFLTTLAVTFGVLVIFGMNSLLPAMLRSFQATMLAASSQVDLTITLRTGETFSPAVLDEVRSVQGVRASQGFLARPLNLPTDFFDQNPAIRDQYSVISLIGLDVEAAQTLRNYTVQSGRFLLPDDTTSAVIAGSLADNLGLKVGDALPLPTAKGLVHLTVVGILPPRTQPGNEEVLVTLPEAQALLDLPGRINTIEADYDTTDAGRRTEIEAAIRARLGEDFQFGALSTNTGFLANLKLAQVMFDVFGFLAIFMGAFIIFNTFRTLVSERRRDFGMLRAIGAGRGTVLGLILAEGLLQGVAGTLVGMALGYLLALGAAAAISPLMEQFIHMRFGTPVISPGLVALSFVFGVGATLLAGLLPAFSAGRVTPLEAIRPTPSPVAQRRALGVAAVIGIVFITGALLVLFTGNASLISLGGMLFLFGLLLVAPALIRPIAIAFGAIVVRIFARDGTGYLAQGNLTRQPTRVAVTASTTLIALAIMVTCGELAVSINHGFLGVLKQTLGSDYLFMPPAVTVWSNNVGADRSFVDELSKIDGVGPISSLRSATAIADVRPSATAQLKGGAQSDGVTVSLLGIDPVTFPQVSGLTFVEGDPAASYAALGSERALIANGVFASSTGARVGDMIPLITPDGKQDYRLVAIAGDFLNTKLASAYISQANMARDFHKTEDVLIQLNLKPGADRQTVEPAIKAVKRAFPQFTMISGQEYYAQMERLFRVAFSSMYVLFLFLALPSLIAMLNTLAIGVIERTREIGMLRAVGATQTQVRRMVLAEALLLAAVGTAFGLLAGLYLGYMMIAAFREGGFPLSYFFPWAGVLITVAIGLLFGALAAIVPARRAAQLDVIAALHYE